MITFRDPPIQKIDLLVSPQHLLFMQMAILTE